MAKNIHNEALTILKISSLKMAHLSNNFDENKIKFGKYKTIFLYN